MLGIGFIICTCGEHKSHAVHQMGERCRLLEHGGQSDSWTQRRAHAGAHGLRNSLISPVFGNYHNFPPMLIQEVGNDLWEVRSNLPNGRIARVMFCIHDRRAVLLYSFIKKTQKTPKPDMNLTLRRKRELER
jgi:hypothetical protein